MKDIPQKSPGDKFFSDECNSIANELENTVKDTGIGLSAADNFQVSKSIANYVTQGDYFSDGGAVNTYLLSAVGSKQVPTALSTGLRARTIPANTNTGASTLKIGSLATKSIVDANGKPLNGGEIIANNNYEFVYDGTYFKIVTSTNQFNFSLLVNKKDGLETSNGTDTDHDIDIAPGSFASQDMRLSFNLYSAFTKQIDANWAEGTNAGGFPNALTLTADTWYHVFVIAKTDGTVDAGFDSSITATNLLVDAADYSHYRRVGSVLTDGSENINLFKQEKNYFSWITRQTDATTIPNVFTDVVLSVPIDVDCRAQIFVFATADGVGGVFIDYREKGATTNEFSLLTIGPNDAGRNVTDIITRDDAIIQHNNSVGTLVTYSLTTLGWQDLSL